MTTSAIRLFASSFGANLNAATQGVIKVGILVALAKCPWRELSARAYCESFGGLLRCAFRRSCSSRLNSPPDRLRERNQNHCSGRIVVSTPCSYGVYDSRAGSDKPPCCGL